MADDNFDELDRLPRSIHVGYLDFGLLLYSILFHFIDVGYDTYIAYSYFITKKYAFLAWTVVFIAIPSIIITLVSIKMYLKDRAENGDNRYAFVRIVLCTLGIFLQSALVIRYFDSLFYAVKSWRAEKKCNKRQQEKFFIKMANENSDVALLRVFECYSESGLQLVLQITLLLMDYISGYEANRNKQYVQIFLSFITMGTCMTVYNRSIRIDQNEKKNLSIAGSLVQFLWHFNFTVSRVLALSALATLYPIWTSVGVVGHWSVMTIWLFVTSDHDFCGKNQFLKFLFAASVGITYIFNFFGLRDQEKRKHYTAFYSVCFVENVFAVAIWGTLSTKIVTTSMYYFFLICPLVTFVLSILFLAIYYKFLHPNKYES